MNNFILCVLTCLIVNNRMNVARLAGIPISVIKTAKEKSDQFEKEMRHVESKQKKLRLLQSVMHENSLSLDNKQQLESLK